jgi:hypothetical protein
MQRINWCRQTEIGAGFARFVHWPMRAPTVLGTVQGKDFGSAIEPIRLFQHNRQGPFAASNLGDLGVYPYQPHHLP